MIATVPEMPTSRTLTNRASLVVFRHRTTNRSPLNRCSPDGARATSSPPGSRRAYVTSTSSGNAASPAPVRSSRTWVARARVATSRLSSVAVSGDDGSEPSCNGSPPASSRRRPSPSSMVATTFTPWSTTRTRADFSSSATRAGRPGPSAGSTATGRAPRLTSIGCAAAPAGIAATVVPSRVSRARPATTRSTTAVPSGWLGSPPGATTA